MEKHLCLACFLMTQVADLHHDPQLLLSLHILLMAAQPVLNIVLRQPKPLQLCPIFHPFHPATLT